jgi:regulator of protease activity HflC (stomatin/prohibitin superfamily)
VYITKFDTLDEHLATSLQEGCRAWAPGMCSRLFDSIFQNLTSPLSFPVVAGIEIISVRVTKPIIPDSVRRNFEQMESEKAKLLIAEQAQKVAEKEAETEKRRRTIQAQAEADVARINAEKQVMEKEAAKRIALIQDQITLEKEKARADAEYYRLVKQAEANALLLTPEFLQYKNIMSLANNLKVYFGEKLPSVFLGYDPSKGPSKQALDALTAGAKLKSFGESLATEEVGTAAGNESGEFARAFTDIDGNTLLVSDE